ASHGLAQIHEFVAQTNPLQRTVESRVNREETSVYPAVRAQGVERAAEFRTVSRRTPTGASAQCHLRTEAVHRNGNLSPLVIHPIERHPEIQAVGEREIHRTPF